MQQRSRRPSLQGKSREDEAPKQPRDDSLPARVARVLSEFELEETDELVRAIALAPAEAFEESPA